MNKKNKKGFTLIEMLVVIAIIAILVAIIIPTVMAATSKAAAATNAANLRSLTAEATTNYLMGGKFEFTTQGVVSKAVDGIIEAGVPAEADADKMIVTFDGHGIAEFAGAAGDSGAIGNTGSNGSNDSNDSNDSNETQTRPCGCNAGDSVWGPCGCGHTHTWGSTCTAPVPVN